MSTVEPWAEVRLFDPPPATRMPVPLVLVAVRELPVPRRSPFPLPARRVPVHRTAELVSLAVRFFELLPVLRQASGFRRQIVKLAATVSGVPADGEVERLASALAHPVWVDIPGGGS